MHRQLLWKIYPRLQRCVSTSEAIEAQKDTFKKFASAYNNMCARATFFQREKLFNDALLPQAAFHEGSEFLDAAGGQGAVTLKYLEKAQKLGIQNYRVRVYDISEHMMECGKRKLKSLPYGNDHVEWIQGDLHELPFEDASFHTFCLSFGMRRIDLEQVCREAYRVLRPGGKMLIFDLQRPDNRFLAWLYWDLYLTRILSLFIPRDKRNDFHLMVEDLKAIPQHDEVESALRKTKFEDFKFCTFQGGISALYTGLKM